MTTQKQHYGIAIFDQEIVLSDYTGPGERRYLITPEQLAGFVRSSITLRPYPGLIWMKSDLQDETHLFTLPAAERTILFRPLKLRGKGKKKEEAKARLKTFKLRLPALAVRARISNGSISGIELWGMNTASLKNDTRLYELPLPNVDGSSLCLGSTIRATEGDIKNAVERTIFDTPFNHHRNTCGKQGLNFPDYIKQHGGRCPLATLKPLGAGKKLLEAR